MYMKSIISYSSKLSSGTLLAMIAFSAVLFTIPLTITVHAANSQPPSFKVTPNVFSGSTQTPVTITITNPPTNQFAVTGFTISAPAGWSFAGSTPSAATFNCVLLSNQAIQCVNGNLAPAPGGLQMTGVKITPPTVSTYPAIGVFTTTVQDQSSSQFYSGPQFTLYEADPATTVTVQLNPSAITAGSNTVTFTVTVTGAGNSPEAGLPVSMTATNPSPNPVGSFSPANGFTDSNGKFTGTYVASNKVSDSPTTVTATVGSFTGSSTLTINPGAPTQITITLPGSSLSTAPNHYITTKGNDAAGNPGAEITEGANDAIKVSLADAFGNPVNWPASGSITITASNGRFNTGPSTVAPSFTCMINAQQCPTSGNSNPWTPPPYFQSTVYGTIGYVTANLVSGNNNYPSLLSGQIITSTFATTSPTPQVSATNVQAGKTVTLTATVSFGQQGVPVQLLVSSATTVHKDGMFVGGGQSVTVFTDSGGVATAKYSVDTGAGATVQFVANVSQPIDGNPTHMLGPSSASQTVITSAGPASGLGISICYDTSCNKPASNTVLASTVYIDVNLVDAYNNTATNTGQGQIQITLAASGGALSATNVYIPSGESDTLSGFGVIAWTVPNSPGTLTLTATATVNGNPVKATAKLGDVSPLPTISVLSPKAYNGVYYSSVNTLLFFGKANISIGYDPTTTNIVSVSYKVNSGSWTLTGAGGAPKVQWSAAPVFNAGLNTVQFNATDNKGNVGLTSVLKVLVDTKAPTIAFTTADGTVIANGSPVNATITVAQGDLNFTSVKAFGNGTVPLTVTVTGSNNLGQQTTYSVTISGLSTGTWKVSLSASTLAGLSASATPITVKVLLPPNLTFTTPGLVQAVVNGQQGVNATIKNNGLAAKASVWFQLLNNKNQVVQGPTFVTTNFAAGQTQSFFFSFSPSLPHGTYTVQVFVTVNGLAYSQTFTLTVTL
jgi:hypothetical protein